MDPWSIAALILILGTVSGIAAPGPTKRASAAAIRLGGRGVRAGAKFGGRHVGAGTRFAGRHAGRAAMAGGRWSWTRASNTFSRAGGRVLPFLAKGAQSLADHSRTSGNPSKGGTGRSKLDRLAAWLRGATGTGGQSGTQANAKAPSSKPSLVKTAGPKPAAGTNPKGTLTMSAVTRAIAAAFDQLAEVEVSSIAELEVILGELSIMWARAGSSYEQFLNNQEAAGVAAKPLRAPYGSLDHLDELSKAARRGRADLRAYYEAYFDQLESGKKVKVGLLDPAKARNAA